jgi:hypothetical protein
MLGYLEASDIILGNTFGIGRILGLTASIMAFRVCETTGVEPLWSERSSGKDRLAALIGLALTPGTRSKCGGDRRENQSYSQGDNGDAFDKKTLHCSTPFLA